MPGYEWDLVGQGTLSRDEEADAGRAANDYSVSLISKGNALQGSATLVSIGKIHGLLTADHVWHHMPKGKANDHFCMVLGPHLQRFEYPFKKCTPIIVGRYSPDHEEEGPDLAFIRLDDPLKLETIRARKSFYLLDAKGSMFDRMDYKRMEWLVWGAPAEQSSRTATQTGEPILRVTHFTGGGEFKEKTERGGFDYVKIRIPSGSYNFPSEYKGVSGGGVWIPIRYSEDPEGRILHPTASVLLAGVAYFQIEEEVDYKTLILHGPKSIYDRVMHEVLHFDESGTT